MAPSFDEYRGNYPDSAETPDQYITSERLPETSAVKLDDTLKEILPRNQYDEFRRFASLLRTDGLKTLVEGTLYGKGSSDSHFWLIPSSVEENQEGQTTTNFTLIRGRNQPSEDARVSQIEVITPKGEEGIHKLKGVITTLTKLGDEDTRKTINFTDNSAGEYKPQGTIKHHEPVFLHNDKIDLKGILYKSRETIERAQKERWFPFHVVTVQQLADAFNGDEVKEIRR